MNFVNPSVMTCVGSINVHAALHCHVSLLLLDHVEHVCLQCAAGGLLQLQWRDAAQFLFSLVIW